MKNLKFHTVLLLLAILNIKISYGQEDRAIGYQLVAVQNNKKLWGYKDSISGKMVIDYQYYKVWPFREGLAFVRSDSLIMDKATGQWMLPEGGFEGVINTTGKRLFRLAQQYIGDEVEKYQADKLPPRTYHDGKAWIYNYRKKLFGFIDTKGKLIIPCEYRIVGNFSEGLAYAYGSSPSGNQAIYYMDASAKPVITIPEKYSFFSNHCFLWDDKGFHNGYAILHIAKWTHDCTENLTIMMDRQGNIKDTSK